MTKIDKKELFYRTRIIKSMVREMNAKHLAAINRGRKAAGLKPIRMKKKTKEKAKIKTNLTQWQKAKEKFKGDRRGLNKYYHSVPRNLKQKYGMPQKAPHVDTKKERDESRARMNQGKCIECGIQRGSLRDGRCAMCD